MPRLAVIGCGNMGSAIVRGLVSSDWASPGEVTITNPRADKAERIAAELGVTGSTDNAGAARGAQVVILGVKPQVIKHALKDLRGNVRDQLVISLAAGISTRFLEHYLPESPIVRAMPNLAVTVGMGATAIAAGTHAEAEHMEQARRIFSMVGTVETVPEVLLDAVTGLSGTGPMYVFHMLEAMADAGVKLGLSRPAATRLAVQTVRGSAELAARSDLHLAALKDQVTSPGGTAITALHVLRSNAFDAILMDAIEAAARRSVELGD